MGRTTKSQIIDPSLVVAFLDRLTRFEGRYTGEQQDHIQKTINIIMGDKGLGETKTCRKCGSLKPATTKFFDADSRNEGGLKHQCKKCRQGYSRRRTKNDRLAHHYIGEDKAAINELRARLGKDHLPEGITHRNASG